MTSTTHAHSPRSSLAVLTLGALGVVFGDIGTSPLYAFKEALGGHHGQPVSAALVFPILSMIFWAVTLVISLKYVTVMLRFDNRGAGGVLALLAFAMRVTGWDWRLRWAVSAAGVMAAALFYGDAIITPAISVLSAVEGVALIAPNLERGIIPMTIGILTVLFFIQRHGTGVVGRWFGPITTIWFLVIAALGVASILQTPEVLGAVNPVYAVSFAIERPAVTFIIIAAVFLTLTGGEALYADMGHFGARPIRIAWFALVFPSLMLNYFGQGALVLRDASAAKNPFYLLAPEPLLAPLVILATLATVIASQATISGAFSITQQATRLGLLPRFQITHTSDVERGQIYIGRVNWAIFIGVIGLVLAFRSSTNLAAAYGIAVSGSMVLETLLVIAVIAGVRDVTSSRVTSRLLLAAVVFVGLLESIFFVANAAKIPEGGWFPLVCAILIFTLLTTWRRGSEILTAAGAVSRVPLAGFFESVSKDVPRVPGTAVFLSAAPEAVPTTLLHNLKHNKVLHERTICLAFATEDVPTIDDDTRASVTVIEPRHVYQVTMRYGFREDPDVPRALRLLERNGLKFDMSDTTFFLGKSSIAPASRASAFTWRRSLFRWMQRNSSGAAEYFRLPPDRVIELGTQLKI